MAERDDKLTKAEQRWGMSLAARPAAACLEAEQLVALASGGGARSRAAWLDHVSACPTCRGAYKDLLALERARRSSAPWWVPVLAALRAPRSLALAGATACALALVVAVSRLPHTPITQEPEMAQKASPPPTPPAAAAMGPGGPGASEQAGPSGALHPDGGVPGVPPRAPAVGQRVAVGGANLQRARTGAAAPPRRLTALASAPSKPVQIAADYGIAFRGGAVYENGVPVPGLTRADFERRIGELEAAPPSLATAKAATLAYGGAAQGAGLAQRAAGTGAVGGAAAAQEAMSAPVQPGAAGGLGGFGGGSALGGQPGPAGPAAAPAAPAGATQVRAGAAPRGGRAALGSTFGRAAGARQSKAAAAPTVAGKDAAKPPAPAATSARRVGRANDLALERDTTADALGAVSEGLTARLPVLSEPDPANRGLVDRKPVFRLSAPAGVSGYRLNLDAVDNAREEKAGTVRLRVVQKPDSGEIVARPEAPLEPGHEYALSVGTELFAFRSDGPGAPVGGAAPRTYRFSVLTDRQRTEVAWAQAHSAETPIASALILYDAGLYDDALAALQLAPSSKRVDAWRARIARQVAERRRAAQP